MRCIISVFGSLTQAPLKVLQAHSNAFHPGRHTTADHARLPYPTLFIYFLDDDRD